MVKVAIAVIHVDGAWILAQQVVDQSRNVGDAHVAVVVSVTTLALGNNALDKELHCLEVNGQLVLATGDADGMILIPSQ